MPTRQEIINYITQAALKRGIDPAVVLRVVQQESSFNPAAANDKTPREKSYGLFQLNTQGGLGVEARKRGIEPTDPSQWKQHVDFSLDTVKRDGWRQWGGARDTGTTRWAGVNTKSPQNIDIGDEPKLQNLAPVAPTRNVSREDSAESSILKQMTQRSPTEQVGAMARYPGFDEAIKSSMTGNTENVQMSGGSQIPPDTDIRGRTRLAGFVPPGLTKGAATTRRAANANVADKGAGHAAGRAAERTGEAGTPYDRSQPSSRGMEGTYGDYVKGEKERMWLEQYKAWREGSGPHPGPSPAGLSEEAINAAVPPSTRRPDDFREPGTAVVPSNQAAPSAGGAVVPATIKGTIDPNSGGPTPRTSTTTPGGRAATAAAATALGVASTDTDPAVQAVQQRINQGHAAAAGAPPTQAANVDAGTMKALAAEEQRAGLPPGTLSSGNAGMETATLGPMIGQALPVFKEVMKDPQGRQAVQTAVKTAITKKAQIDAQRADVRNDPTYYQQMAARGQMPGGVQDDRAMERAVMMDNQRALARRMGSQPPQQQVPPRPPAPIPQTTRGTVNARSTPPEIRNTTEEQILNQVIPPGAEKGDVPPPQRTPVPRGYPQDQPMQRNQSMQRVPASAPWPYDVPPSPEAVNPSGPMQQPQMNPQMMDPTMMQLMQFFTQGGGNGGVG